MFQYNNLIIANFYQKRQDVLVRGPSSGSAIATDLHNTELLNTPFPVLV